MTTVPSIASDPETIPTEGSYAEEGNFIPIAQSSNGRVNGKGWKTQKAATKYVRHSVQIRHLLTSTYEQTLSYASRRKSQIMGV